MTGSLLRRLAPALVLGLAACASGAPEDALPERVTAPPPPPADAPFAEAITGFVQADAAAPPADCSVLFVGSSSIRFWTTVAEDFPELSVINRGFGGSQTEHVIRYFNHIVAPYRPAKIVFYEGENDINAGDSTDSVISEFETFMDMKTAALGATPVYFISIKPSIARFEELAAQAEANERLAAIAANRPDMTFINVVDAMLDEDGQPKDIFVADDLHMNADGYAIWTEIVGEALETAEVTESPFCAG
ncbi:MAG: GDSL-type esterase/lipase family protein [Maricaulaceae bacterium]|jgi:lysophospholipase L1-like esterase